MSSRRGCLLRCCCSEEGSEVRPQRAMRHDILPQPTPNFRERQLYCDGHRRLQEMGDGRWSTDVKGERREIRLAAARWWHEGRNRRFDFGPIIKRSTPHQQHYSLKQRYSREKRPQPQRSIPCHAMPATASLGNLTFLSLSLCVILPRHLWA